MNGRILILDKEAEVRGLLRRALTKQGYELEEADDTSAGLARLETFRPQVVISESDPPGTEIVSLLEKIQKMEEPPLVILLATAASKERAIQALSVGAHDYLVKPFELAELSARVGRAMERKKLLAELECKNKDCEVACTELAVSQKRVREYASQLEQNLRELQNSQLQLIQSEKMASLGRLVAGVAHEINSPMGVMNSNNDLLTRMLPALRNYVACLSPCPEKEKMVDLLEVLSNTAAVDRIACERITQIVKNLKNFARLDEADRKPFDIHEGLDSTLRLVQCEFGERIRVEKAYGDLPPIACYPNQLNQVFMNLLVNAGEAMEGEGVIRITTQVLDGNVVIKISDTGKGIPPAHLSKIFDPGFTTKGVGVGTGLGLSITYKIVQDHGGTIQAESQVGRGTMFTITLPVR